MTSLAFQTIRPIPSVRHWSPGAQTVLAVVVSFVALAAAAVAIAEASDPMVAGAQAEASIALALSIF